MNHSSLLYNFCVTQFLSSQSSPNILHKNNFSNPQTNETKINDQTENKSCPFISKLKRHDMQNVKTKGFHLKSLLINYYYCNNKCVYLWKKERGNFKQKEGN